jgi:hypothetical protein
VKVTLARLWPAILCALLLPLCGLAIQPYAEIGFIDDGPYIKTAQTLAQTGHIVYNGWATGLLGWPLYLAAALVKLFGSSFTVVRSATEIIAMATAFLLQRTFVRAGIGQWNATIGTLTFVLSPLLLPLSFTFMTDLPGLFGIILCLYACLRALQTTTTNSAIAWICFATASNAIAGTARQPAWLGTVVMVPCTLWLLRRRPRLLRAGLLVWIAGCIAIFALLRWYYLQPYAIHEDVTTLGKGGIRGFYQNTLRSALNFPAYLLPIVAMFIPAVPWKDRRAVRFVFWAGLACLLIALAMAKRGDLVTWLAPMGDWFTIRGAADGLPIKGTRPVLIPVLPRLLATAGGLAGMIGLIALSLGRGSSTPSKPPQHPAQAEAPSWHELAVLLIPMSLGYLLILLPRAIFVAIFDRYLLALFVVALIFLLRFYQDRVQPRLPAASLLLVAIYAVYGVAATHDAFSMFRARLAALNELHAAGIPGTAIDGGFDTNMLTQIAQTGYLNDPRIKVPAGIYVPKPAISLLDVCHPEMGELLPAVQPRYALSFDPAACAGPTNFAPIAYREWLSPHSVNIYIIHVAP